MWNLRSAVHRSIFSQSFVFILSYETRIMHIFVEVCGRSDAAAFLFDSRQNKNQEG